MEELNMDFIQDDVEFLENLTEEESENSDDKKNDDKSDNKTDDKDVDKTDKSDGGSNDETDDDDKTDVKTDSEKDDKGDDKKDGSDIYKSFAEGLKEEGVIDFEENVEIKTSEDLAKLIQKEIEKNEFSGLSKDQKEYLESLESGFSTEEFQKNKESFLEIEKLKEENLEEKEDLQKQIMIRDFTESGISKERAEKLADRSFDLNKNLEDSKESLENIEKREKDRVEKEKENRKKEIENSKKNNQKILENLKQRVYDEEKEIVPGVKYNKNVADKIFKNLTEPVEYDDNNRPVSALAKEKKEDPIEFDRKLNSIYVLTDGFKDFSIFEKSNKTKKMKNFEDRLKDSSHKTSGKGHSGNTNSNNNEDFNQVLEELENSLNQ